ncbi:uncharacterized protein LOC111313835 [Durio zibethinus]|uniref:Uncharacterized protein LOC111313835 n=1 Tax=Durio zibethinus TaxID=66656 RepID=A0A6P6AZL0_DURZI|nr:uncharacterized protein LOC111313835 [Durio zibethinus]XP_022770368.1 uncharacterized protein LOC111313835 [Durio zibethinus]XP_022770371.1 uncharacterized protein LOC111313835 [Durio zibethinus]XP_022770372.1 uncharacterized protein LOC111313835 [Durio zibethinus]XP_022770373.1 uncharacterized protein LOC111313835 [Durio zibethinus]XP_022770374.1 uncharacterized protein LOC111313835 [Durio zibethinus]
MADKNSLMRVPEHWTLVVKEQEDGSSLSYYTCLASGQKFYSYEDLMRYVNYAKAAKLSIYSPDFSPIKQKAKASRPDFDRIDISSDSEDSASKLPSVASNEVMEVASPAHSVKQSLTGKMKFENRASNGECSSSGVKAKKQKM